MRHPRRPNILLITPDTLRADALGAWGHRPSVTPALDALAAESDVWLDAYSTFNVTNPSFASLMTGLYGKDHGVYDLHTPLPESHRTLAEVLRDAGYRTHAIVSAQHLGPHNSGLDQGFDAVAVAQGNSAAELAVDEAMDWLQRQDDATPSFLWLHLFDPHTPHTPQLPYALGYRAAAPRGLAPRGGWVPFRTPGPRAFRAEGVGGDRDLYAGEVAYLDRQIDRLLGFLDSRGALRDTLVVVVADHGENLEDHGIAYRHSGLWNTTTHVPLMIRWPGAHRQGRRLHGLVQQIDLFPTLIAVAGAPVPRQDGEDLRRLTGPGHSGRPAAFSEHSDRQGAAVRTRHFRYYRSAGNPIVDDGVYFYALDNDPQELANRAGKGDPAEARLAALLDRWLATGNTRERPTPRKLTEEEAAQLRALGYL